MQLVNPDGTLNLTFIKNAPMSDKFDLVADGFNHLLNQSSSLNYSITYDAKWMYYLLDIQVGPFAWLQSSVEILYSLVHFTYDYQTLDEHLRATRDILYKIADEGVELVREFKEHQKAFTEFITSTLGGQWSLANIKAVLAGDHGLRLSSSYRRQVNDNMRLYNRVKDYQRRLNKIEVEFCPPRRPQVGIHLIKLDKFYGPPGLVLYRYPGFPPGRRYTINILLEHKIEMSQDIYALGTTPSHLKFYYSV